MDVIEIGPLDADLLSYLTASADRSGRFMIRRVKDADSTIVYHSMTGQPAIYGRINVLHEVARQTATATRPSEPQSTYRAPVNTVPVREERSMPVGSKSSVYTAQQSQSVKASGEVAPSGGTSKTKLILTLAAIVGAVYILGVPWDDR